MVDFNINRESMNYSPGAGDQASSRRASYRRGAFDALSAAIAHVEQQLALFYQGIGHDEEDAHILAGADVEKLREWQKTA